MIGSGEAVPGRRPGDGEFDLLGQLGSVVPDQRFGEGVVGGPVLHPGHHVTEVGRIAYEGREGGVADLGSRWTTYEFAKEQIVYYLAAYGALGASPDATILDVGCSDGTGLALIRAAVGHQGRLRGLDISKSIFEPNGRKKNEALIETGFAPLEFFVGYGDEMPFPDNSVDHALAMFMLYYAEDPIAVLQDIKRVVRPGGRVVTGTSGAGNKARQREFEVKLGEALGAIPPALHTQSFLSEHADILLPQMFRHLEEKTIRQSCMARFGPVIRGVDGFFWYRTSLDGMRSFYNPVPSIKAWNGAMHEVVEPVVRESFEQHGYYEEPVERVLHALEVVK